MNMNKKMIFYVLGQIIKLEGVFMCLPLVCALIYGETRCATSFAVTMWFAVMAGFVLTHVTRGCDRTIYAREGFVICAFAWLSLASIGAVPFVLSGDIPSYIDAFFETVSGFTTTGSSILTDPASLAHGALFWRSFTHWIGGMGVLVLMMALIPNDNARSMYIMRAEMPGPVIDKIVPRARDTAKILYLIYIALTGVMVIFLLAGGMPLFDSLVHAFGTAGTGGLAIKSDSIASYSPYLQWVITVFMLIFSVNFNIYYLVLAKKLRQALKSEELWAFIGIVVCSTAMIAVNISRLYGSFGEVLRHSAAQVASIISTTGFATVDFNLWPGFSKTVLVILMFIGACAGSTAGGLKVSRVLLLGKIISRELKTLAHPRSLEVVKLDGKRVDDATITGVGSYLALYFLLFGVILVLVSTEPFDFETCFTSVATCFNNVGPGFGGIGPMSNFASFSPAAKLLLSGAMLLGRLELYPLVLTFSVATWARK